MAGGLIIMSEVIKAFGCNGIWWLPENPSERVAGTLCFSDDDGIDLSLAGVFGEPAPGIAEKYVPIILGLVWDYPLGKLVTLKGCRVHRFHLGSPGIGREVYFADRLFVGSHIEREEDFSFSHLSVSLSGLSDWAGVLTGLSQQFIPVGKEGRKKFEIRWQSPEPIRGRIPGGDLALGVEGKVSLSRREGSIKEKVWFSISCDNPHTEDELLARYAYPLQNFMTLATDHPNAQVEVTVRRPGEDDRIHVIAARVFHDAKAAEDLMPHKMLFSLEDVKDRAVALISRWMEVSERFAGVVNPYFGIQYEPKSFVDTKFLIVFQSLEVYSRLHTQGGGSIVTPSDQSLGHLFTKLLEEHWKTVGPLFGLSLEGTVAELMKYRNYVVHRDSDIGKEPDYSRKLYWLTQKLMFLMKACLLTELGFTSDELDRFFRRNQMFVHILNMVEK